MSSCYVLSTWCGVWFSFFFFKQKTAYEMRISEWSSDVCSSDLSADFQRAGHIQHAGAGVSFLAEQLRCGLDDRAALEFALFLGSESSLLHITHMLLPLIWLALFCMQGFYGSSQIGRAHV